VTGTIIIIIIIIIIGLQLHEFEKSPPYAILRTINSATQRVSVSRIDRWRSLYRGAIVDVDYSPLAEDVEL